MSKAGRVLVIVQDAAQIIQIGITRVQEFLMISLQFISNNAKRPAASLRLKNQREIGTTSGIKEDSNSNSIRVVEFLSRHWRPQR